MNAVVYYSKTNESKKIAEYFSKKLNYNIIDIEIIDMFNFNNLILAFPVHCQNIPNPVKLFLNNIKVNNLTIIATYGKMCPGNVLKEIQNKYHKNIVAAAYVPTKHSYIVDDNSFNEYCKLDEIITKINNPSIIQLPKMYKNPLSNLFPKLRSRIGVKIYKNNNCNNCNVCNKVCSLKAINCGITNNNCIRCLKCVQECPMHALKFKNNLFLKIYLKKKKNNELIIYI